MSEVHASLLVLALFLTELLVLSIVSRRRRARAIDAEGAHFMPSGWRALPPVSCPLLIKVDGKVLRATRTSHIERPDGEMNFVTECGRQLVGRFDWTYP